MHLHEQEKEQFKKLFKQENIDRFSDRFDILESFLQFETHITAEALKTVLDEQKKHFSLDFIQNTLKLMCDFGFARANTFENGMVHYEHWHLGHHHDHMICTKCRTIIEFENPQMESLQVKIASGHGFHGLTHKMEIYGICANCLKNRIKNMPLSMAKPGESLVIQSINGGTTVKMRLMSMGLRVGDTITVINNPSRGQVVLALDFNRYVIGQGFAEKIMVTQKEST